MGHRHGRGFPLAALVYGPPACTVCPQRRGMKSPQDQIGELLTVQVPFAPTREYDTVRLDHSPGSL